MVLLKWVGSKTASCKVIADKIGTVSGRYIEPCIGGGAVLFELQSRKSLNGEIFVSDTDADLINFWKAIRDYPEDFKQHVRHKVENGTYCHKNYYHIRKIFNGEKTDSVILNTHRDHMRVISSAAVVYYLNRTCFNGLWRRNSKGEFNVPVGSNSGINLTFMDSETDRYTKLLQNVHIDCVDFEEAVRKAQKGDVVYFDPPYYSKDGTNFTQYGGEIFDKEKMDTLYAVATNLSIRGVRVFISAPGYFEPTKIQAKRVKETYILMVGRPVNRNGGGREPVEEKLMELEVGG